MTQLGNSIPWLNEQPFKQYILYGLIILGAGGAFFALNWYFGKQADKAQRMYSEAADQYHKAIAGYTTAWEDLEFIAQAGYDRYKNSLFGPYLLNFKAEAQLSQKKDEQALETVEKMVNTLDRSSVLYPFYKTKLALMKLDSADPATQDKGLKELEVLAYDKRNGNYDQALYYLGLYYWIEDNKEKAVSTWRHLVQELGAYENEKASPWATLAEDKLNEL